MYNGVAKAGYLQMVRKLEKEEVLTFCLKCDHQKHWSWRGQVNNETNFSGSTQTYHPVDLKSSETLGTMGQKNKEVGGLRDHIVTFSTLIAVLMMNVLSFSLNPYGIGQ